MQNSYAGEVSWRHPAREVLRAFLDLDHVVCHETVCFTVHGLSRFLTRGVYQTEHCSLICVKPVSQVVRSVFALYLKIFLMGPRDRFRSQALYVPVRVHISGITHIKLPGSKQRTILDESHRSISHGCRQPSNQAHKTISRRGELAAPGSGGGFHHVCTPFKLLRARTSPLVASLHL